MPWYAHDLEWGLARLTEDRGPGRSFRKRRGAWGLLCLPGPKWGIRVLPKERLWLAGTSMTLRRRDLKILVAIGSGVPLLLWARSAFLWVPFPPAWKEPQKAASGLFWRQCYFDLENLQAAEEFVSFYQQWAAAAGWQRDTDPKYGLSWQWTSFVDATRTPPRRVIQWCGQWKDKRGLRGLFLSVRTEVALGEQHRERELGYLEQAPYRAHVTISLRPPASLR